jgi:hypothetical protein
MKMVLLARLLIALIAVFFLVSGLGFWFAHDQLTAQFAIQTQDVLGRASIRADFGGFFLGVGIMSAMAAWRQSPAWATGAALLLGLAFVGRVVSIMADGPATGGTVPMLVEAGAIAILLWGRSVWRTA